MHRERGTKLAVEAFERMSHRHIWKEEAERRQRGVTHALTPPAIVNWDLVLICAVLFAVAAYMLSAWLLEEPPPSSGGGADRLQLGLARARLPAWLQDAIPRGMQARVTLDPCISVPQERRRRKDRLPEVRSSHITLATERATRRTWGKTCHVR